MVACSMRWLVAAAGLATASATVLSQHLFDLNVYPNAVRALLHRRRGRVAVGSTCHQVALVNVVPLESKECVKGAAAHIHSTVDIHYLGRYSRRVR